MTTVKTVWCAVTFPENVAPKALLKALTWALDKDEELKDDAGQGGWLVEVRSNIHRWYVVVSLWHEGHLMSEYEI